MTALLPSLILPTGSFSSLCPPPPSPSTTSSHHPRTKWTPANPVMPVSFVSLANSSFEEDHYEIGLETLAGFCDGEFAPSVSHLLILLHLSLTSPSPPTIQSTSLSLLNLISTLNSPRSLLQAIPPNTTGSNFHDERDISTIDQLSRRIIHWKNWFEGLTGDKPGQARALRKDTRGGGGEQGGWEVGMGKRNRKGKGKGKMGGSEKEGERDAIVEEDNWWEVTKVLVGLWERDLREVREWDPAEHLEEEEEEASKDPPLPLFLSQFPTDGSSNPRKPRSDIANVVKVIFDTYPKTRSVSKKGVIEENEDEVDFSRTSVGEGEGKGEEEEVKMEERREIAGRLMGLILTLTTPPTPFLSPSRYTIHLLSPFSHLPTSHLPHFFSLLPISTPTSAILLLLASLLNSDSPSGPIPTPELFVSKLVKVGGKTKTKTLRSAVVKVLMMGRLDWSGKEKEEVRVELREGWREGVGVKGVGREEEMEVDGSGSGSGKETKKGGEGWRWVEEIGERIIQGLEGGAEEKEETEMDTVRGMR